LTGILELFVSSRLVAPSDPGELEKQVLQAKVITSASPEEQARPPFDKILRAKSVELSPGKIACGYSLLTDS